MSSVSRFLRAAGWSTAIVFVAGVANPLPGQIGHWEFDGDLLDATAVNDGVFFGGPEPLFVAGYDGTPRGAVFFDGVDDYVQIPDNELFPTLALIDNFTLALWFRASSTDQSQKYLLSRNGGGGQYAIIYEYTDDRVDFFAPSRGFGDDPRAGGASEMVLADTEWHHIAYTYDGFVWSGYIDGEEQFTTDISFSLSDAFFASWWIGAANPNANHVRGVIDDVRIYDSALDADEIADLYSEPVTVECPGAGDTHATSLDIVPPDGGGPGVYTATAAATDDSGDSPLYTFSAREEKGTTLSVGPQTSQTAELQLGVGSWTLSVTVDDDPLCPDEANDATIESEPIDIALVPRLLGHWEFDGDLVDSAGSNDGVYFGGDVPTFVDDHEGNEEGAIWFDGFSQFVEIPPTQELALRDRFTVAFWFRAETLEQVQTYLLSRNDSIPGGSGKQYAVIYEYTDNRVDFFAPNRSAGPDPRAGGASEMPIEDAEWHHVAYTNDGSQWSGYIDGVQVFSTAIEFALDDTFESSWWIGTANLNVGYVNGAFDDVRLYNYALTAEEVQDLTGLENPCPTEGDTHVSDLTVEGALDGLDGGPGTYEVSADGTDESGDVVSYRFTATDGLGGVLSVGPQEEDTANFLLGQGTWTISVTVDDDPLCPDAAEDATASTTIDVTVPPALLAHWELDGDLSDASGTHDGLFFGDVEPLFVAGFDGTDGGALETDGLDDYVEIPPALDLALANRFTLALWFRAASNDQSQKYLLSRNAPGAQYAIIYEYVDDSIEFFAGGSFAGDDPRPGSAMPLTDTDWHHIAYTYDGVTLTGYIDGEVIVSNPRAFSLRFFESSWYLGAANPQANHVAGALDDVRIYNFALTAEEISELAGGVVKATRFLRGDSDSSGAINITDGIFVLNFLFLGGPNPSCADAADADDSGTHNITDGIYVLNFLFLGGPNPPSPGTESCGDDPTVDDLDCAEYSNCP